MCVFIYRYTSQDPPISIGGARKEICTKRDHDQKGRSTNVIKKFDQQFWSRNSIKKFDQEIWSRKSVSNFDQDFRSESNFDRTSIQSWSIFGRSLIEFPSKYDRIVIECWSIELRSNCDHIIIEFCSMFARTLHQTLVNVWSKFDPILLQLWSNFDQILIENHSRDPPGAPWTSKGCAGTIWSVPGALWECPGSGSGAPKEHQARYF